MSEPEKDPTQADAEALFGELLEQTHRRLWIHTPVDTLAEFGRIELGSQLAAIARRHRHTDIRILIDDDLALKERMPALVESIKRLPTAISVRRLERTEDTPLVLTVIADQGGWLQYTQAGGQRVLRGDVDDRPGAGSAARDFEANWSLSDESAELRRLMV